MHISPRFLYLSTFAITGAFARAESVRTDPAFFSITVLNSTQPDWGQLKRAVDGRLFDANPLAKPCFPASSSWTSEAFDSGSCLDVRSQYTNESMHEAVDPTLSR